MVAKSKAVVKSKAPRSGGSKHFDGNPINAHASNADWDEDIEDDLAFNSDDEAQFGHHFAKSSSSSAPKKDAKKEKAPKKKSKKNDDDDEEEEGMDFLFDRLNAIGGDQDDGAAAKDNGGYGAIVPRGKTEKLEARKTKASAGTKVSALGGRSGAMSTSNLLVGQNESLIAVPSKVGITSSAKEPTKHMKEAEELAELSEAYANRNVSTMEGKKQLKKLLNSAAADEATAGAANRLKAAASNTKTLMSEDVDEYRKSQMDRQQTRALVDKSLKRYNAVLREHREAKHLSFPLNQPDSNPVATNIGSMAASLSSKKQTGIAAKMQQLLDASGLTARPIAGGTMTGAAPDGSVKFSERPDGAEDREGGEDEFLTGMNKEGADGSMSTGYISKLKAMLSYEVARRTRLNKIKSKTYRRIIRKEEDREKQRRDQAFEILNPEAARLKRQEKMEKERALERATQKHKNTSKWIRHAKQFSKFDDDTKEAIQQQHMAHQRLMAKMDEDAGEEWGEIDEAEKASREASAEADRAVDELLTAEDSKKDSIFWNNGKSEGGDAAPVGSKPIDKARASLKDMEFMKRAKKRDDEEYAEEVDRLKEDVARYKEGLGSVDRKPAVSKSGGRKVFEGPGATTAAEEAADDAGLSMDAVLDGEVPAPVQKKAGAKRPRVEVKEFTAPGLKVGGEAEEHQASFVEADFDELADTSDFVGKRGTGAAGSKKKDTTTEAPKKYQPTKPTRITIMAEEATTTTTVETQQQQIASNAGVDQEYLVTRAFAKDEIDEDFMALKDQQTESVMRPADRNMSLPGWGEWGGENDWLNSQHKERVAQKELARKIEKTTLMKSRADAHLDNVIINHDVDILPSKYSLHMVPRPFSNSTEFLRSMRHPTGPEWNTPLTFKEGTQPRITTKQGVGINPLDLTLRKAKAKTARKKVNDKKEI